jgi:hypothetical protein
MGLSCTWTCLYYCTEPSYTTWAWAAPGRVCTTVQSQAAPERVYTNMGLSCTWPLLHNRSPWTCLYFRGMCCTAPGPAKQRPAPGRVYTTGSWAAPGRVFTKRHLLHLDVVCNAWKFVPWEIYEILYMEIITEFRKILSNYATRNSANFRGILGNSARNTQVTEVQKTHGIPCCHDSYPFYWHLAPKFQNSLSAFTLALLPVEWNKELDSTKECILIRGELCKSVSGYIAYRHMLNHNSWLVGTLLQKELVLTGLKRWRLHTASIFAGSLESFGLHSIQFLFFDRLSSPPRLPWIELIV